MANLSVDALPGGAVPGGAPPGAGAPAAEAPRVPGRAPVRWRLVDNAVFLGFHVAVAVMAWTVGWPGASVVGFGLFAYLLGMFAITAGYHRYFSHRTYRTSRAFQLLLAFLGTCTLQKGVLWWAAHHRKHHKHSDTEDDIHSPARHGLLWAHMGWIMSPAFMETDHEQVKDLSRFPELRWLNTHFILTPALLGVVVGFGLGWAYFVAGCVAIVALWHATFTINSLSHVWGTRTYATTDDSRNNALLALLTMGEGWHNNHHYYAASVRQGFRWWQLDVSYLLLCALERLGIVWGLKRPPAEVVDGWLGGKNLLAAAAPRAAATAAGASEEPARAAA